MHRRRILFSWIGFADLRVLAAVLPPVEQAQVLKKVPEPGPTPGQSGPLKCLLNKEDFDEVHLLSHFDDLKNQHYGKWIGPYNPVLHSVTVKDPSDYTEVFKVVNAELTKVVPLPRTERDRVGMHLSPGTPTMTAIWLLLGKSSYKPTTFYQTYKGKARITDIPFDLVVDYVPQVLHDAEARLQRFASQSPQDVEGFESIVGESHKLRVAVGQVQRAAQWDVSILLLGESGTGKERFARAIHASSSRKDNEFVPINCAAISRELLESELFGHSKGAFTGALEARQGAFEKADGGTLFLDEIGECSLAMQAKLLRVLEPRDNDPCQREFYRVGESSPTKSNVRIIAATNRDLHAAIAAGQFRDDLYYRLAHIKIKLPPLRDRGEDIPRLVEWRLAQINDNFQKQRPGYQHKCISESAKVFMQRHSWPGNVRQLYNTLLQAAVMADGEVIERQDVADAIDEVFGKAAVDLLEHSLGDGFSLTDLLEGIQRHYLLRGMEEAGGVKTKAAKLLGYKHYQTLDEQLKRLKVEVTRK